MCMITSKVQCQTQWNPDMQVSQSLLSHSHIVQGYTRPSRSRRNPPLNTHLQTQSRITTNSHDRKSIPTPLLDRTPRSIPLSPPAANSTSSYVSAQLPLRHRTTPSRRRKRCGEPKNLLERVGCFMAPVQAAAAPGAGYETRNGITACMCVRCVCLGLNVWGPAALTF